VHRSAVVAADGDPGTPDPGITAYPRGRCSCSTEAPCGATSANPTGLSEAGASLRDKLPLSRPSWCVPTPWWSSYSGSYFLLSGCGMVGVRETRRALPERRFETVERWYDLETGDLAGLARSSSESGIACEGVLPPPDCPLADCTPCAPSLPGRERRDTCGLEDVGLASTEWSR